MTAAFNFLCHVEAFLQSLHKFPRQCVAVGKLSTAQGGLLSPRAVQWHTVRSCIYSSGTVSSLYYTSYLIFTLVL